MKRGYIVRQIGSFYEVGHYDSWGNWQLARKLNNMDAAVEFCRQLNLDFQNIMNDYNEKINGIGTSNS